MRGYRKIVLGFALAAALSAPAFAQRLSNEATGALNVDVYTLMVVQPNGQMTMVHVDKAMADELMKHAKPMAKTMVLEHAGKSWVVDDMKMPGGMMVSDFLTREQKLP